MKGRKNFDDLLSLVLVIAAVLIILGAVGGLIGVYSARAFFGSSPMCISCHDDMDMVGEYESGHPMAGFCYNCHERTPELIEEQDGGLTKIVQFVPHWFSANDDIMNRNCNRCHTDVLNDIYSDDSPKVIKISHKKHIGEGLVCTDCHSNVAHNKSGEEGTYRPQKSDCYRCHLRDIEGSARNESCQECHYIILENTGNTASAGSVQEF